MSLRVLEPGPCSLVVDLGRPSHRSFGVSLGGAADRAALIQGNALVGNSPNAAALEFAMVGPTLQATNDIGCIVFGAPFSMSIGDRILRAGIAFNLKSGETLKVGTTSTGLRGYLCVHGGLKSKELLGSRSGLEPIQRGDELPCDPSRVTARSLVEPLISYDSSYIRCVDGPQAEWFDLSQFFGPQFRVSLASNRMGLRLSGMALTRPTREMTSEPVAPGSVQVVNDGQCIILGVDGQTIGGYPKVAQVISADLDRLGQLRPGQIVRFLRVELNVAEELFRQRCRLLANLLTRLTA